MDLGLLRQVSVAHRQGQDSHHFSHLRLGLIGKTVECLEDTSNRYLLSAIFDFKLDTEHSGLSYAPSCQKHKKVLGDIIKNANKQLKEACKGCSNCVEHIKYVDHFFKKGGLSSLVSDTQRELHKQNYRVRELQTELREIQRQLSEKISENSTLKDANNIYLSQLEGKSTEEQTLRSTTGDLSTRNQSMTSKMAQQNKRLAELQHRINRELNPHAVNVARPAAATTPDQLVDMYTMDLYEEEHDRALDQLQDDFEFTEEEGIGILFTAVTVSYECTEKALQNYTQGWKASLRVPTIDVNFNQTFHGHGSFRTSSEGKHSHSSDSRHSSLDANLPRHVEDACADSEEEKELFDRISHTIRQFLVNNTERHDLKEINQDVLEQLRTSLQCNEDVIKSSCLKRFVRHCVRVFWKMVVLDPPMKLDWSGAKMDKEVHEDRWGCTSGEINYFIWPALYNGRGKLVCKAKIATKRQGTAIQADDVTAQAIASDSGSDVTSVASTPVFGLSTDEGASLTGCSPRTADERACIPGAPKSLNPGGTSRFNELGRVAASPRPDTSGNDESYRHEGTSFLGYASKYLLK
ncbi:uncharacterized protein LOC106162476 [Lingula anatina]|uniref:Mitochondria-eating protein n=1 Tax=Lingula anatina TaxID=7574 RepID=A0A1S3ICS4_LINAN|nr:uncharacterized protein LOC106162476 [Lingula anatina]|eukprot:XP_013395234.1 uncharacterized protein LOC106162476 [Lingula anatina]